MPESTVSFNGTSKNATYMSDTQLMISLTAADLAQVRNCGVIVTNPEPGSGMSNTAFFGVIPQPNPYPNPYDY